MQRWHRTGAAPGSDSPSRLTGVMVTVRVANFAGEVGKAAKLKTASFPDCVEVSRRAVLLAAAAKLAPGEVGKAAKLKTRAILAGP